MDRSRFSAMMTALAEIYQREVGHGLLAMYYSILGSYSDHEVAEAIRRHVEGPDGRFWPTPSHILASMRGDSDVAASNALATLQGAIKDFGWPSPQVFDDPLINRVVVAMGGWVEVCQMSPEMLIPHFRKCYVPLHRSGARADMADNRGFLPSASSAPQQIGQILQDRKIEAPAAPGSTITG